MRGRGKSREAGGLLVVFTEDEDELKFVGACTVHLLASQVDESEITLLHTFCDTSFFIGRRCHRICIGHAHAIGL